MSVGIDTEIAEQQGGLTQVVSRSVKRPRAILNRRNLISDKESGTIIILVMSKAGSIHVNVFFI